MFPSHWWRRNGGLVCQLKQKKQTRITGIIQCQLHQAWVIFSIIFFFFGSLLWWSSMYATLAQSWKWSIEEAEHIYRYRQEEAVLSPSCSTTMPWSMTLETGSYIIYGSSKAETLKKIKQKKSSILCMICCLLSLIWWRLSPPGYMRKLVFLNTWNISSKVYLALAVPPCNT